MKLFRQPQYKISLSPLGGNRKGGGYSISHPILLFLQLKTYLA
jgi:hypothetical protein